MEAIEPMCEIELSHVGTVRGSMMANLPTVALISNHVFQEHSSDVSVRCSIVAESGLHIVANQR